MNKSLLALCLGASFLLNGFVFIRFSPVHHKQLATKHEFIRPINLKLLRFDNFNQLLNSKHQQNNRSFKWREYKQNVKQQVLNEIGKRVRQESITESSLKEFLQPVKPTKQLAKTSLLQEVTPIKHKSFVSVQNSKNQNLERNKHFSFYQRILEDYINKLTANLISQNPTISPELAGEELVGRIIFDVKGNAQALKILKWSRNNKFQEFFLHSLKEIRNIPNPPTELISTNEDFTVTYGLKVVL